jgi:hypothetical protein
MKKIFLIASIVLGVSQLNAQTVSVLLEYKSAQDSFYVSMIPSFSQGVFNLGPAQITLVFSNNYGISAPASSVIATSSDNAATWVAQDFVLEAAAPNKRYVGFQTTGQNIGSLIANIPKPLFRFRVTGPGGNCVGGLGQLRNYVNGVDLTDPTGGVSGGDFSTVITDGLTAAEYFSTNSSTVMQDCNQLILPVNLLGFSAVKQAQNALINWSVTGENYNTSYYELERSTDGSTFAPIAKITSRRLTGVQQYEYTDVNIIALGTRNLYYRVKQVDFNGKSTASGIRNIRLDADGAEVQIFPNPAKEGFYVTVPVAEPGTKKVKLSLIAPDGRIVGTREISAQQAYSYYFNIKDKPLAAGQYNLQIIYDDKVLSNKKIFINQ